MTISIRLATTRDAAKVARCVHSLLGELAPDHPANPAILEARAERILAMPTVHGFLAEDEKGPAGLAMLNDCAAIYAGGSFGEITELWVDPLRRSQGIAAALVAAIRSFGEGRGWQRIEVGAPEQPVWARTVEFYKREGFSEVGPRLRLLL
jgi:GNAT superfamily N-acetyltransferase